MTREYLPADLHQADPGQRDPEEGDFGEGDFQQALRHQAAELRSTAVRAGAGAAVPTCPGWDVRQLVRHLAQVCSMVALALDSPPDGERPRAPHAPEDFDDALQWWDEQLDELATKLSTSDSQRPVWAFFPSGTAASWTRRIAHETAIHRLDAEHALAGAEHVHDLIVHPALAADGVDEVLGTLLPTLHDWSERGDEGRVLYHAADTEHAWFVTFRPGEPPEVRAPHGTAPQVDSTVAGTADALYRRVWGRPSTAVVSGDPELAGIISGR